MRVSRISPTVIFSLTLLGTAAWLPAQVAVEKEAPVSTELKGADTLTHPVMTEAPPMRPAPAETASPRRNEVRVTVDRLNVRARPGTSYEVVAKVSRDQKLTVVGEQGEWLEILPPPGTAAWCSSKFINDHNSVIGHNVRVRSGPGVVFSIFATLPEGASVTPVGAPVGQWRQIEVPSDATVWIHGQFVDPVEPPVMPETDVAVPPVSDSDENNGETSEPEKQSIPKLSLSGITGEDGEKTADKESGEKPESGPGDKEDGELPPPMIIPEKENPGESENGSTPLNLPLEGEKTGTTTTSAEQPTTGIAGNKPPDFGETSPLNNDGTEKAGLNNQNLTHEGIIISLKSKATAFVTHALIRREGDKTYLLCYLISDVIDLNEWENRRVRLYGKPLDYPDWKTEALDATGIQLLFP